MNARASKRSGRKQPLLRFGSSLVATALAVLAVSTARGDGVGFLTVAKTLPEATIAVIDPESGTSSGGSSSDVRIAVGDIILFRFRYMPVPQSQLGGVNGWLTEYIPPNLQVVGVRLIDEDGITVRPNPPGLAQDDTGARSNNWSTTPCSGSTCPVSAGGIAQLYGDTGVFFSTDARTARAPANAFITLGNGLGISVPESLRTDSNLRAALGISAPYFVHNEWDQIQFGIFGGNIGNTPHLYGSPVAGPNTHYRHEATLVSGTTRFNSVVGPWNRIRYPGSFIATGGLGTVGQTRTILEASTLGRDLTPNNSLPHVLAGAPASANAVRIATGEVRGGLPVFVEIAFRVMGVPLDPGFGATGGDMNCGESVGGDVSGTFPDARGDDNMWSYWVPSPACVFLNLLFDITVDEIIRTNATAYDDMAFSIRARNLSLNPRNNVWVRQRYNPSRLSLSDDPGLPPFPDLAPTCQISNCDGDGFACIYWNLGTLDPSEEVIIRTNLEVNNGGDPTTPVRADFTSDDLGTRSGNPCAGGAITSPGFRTQEAVQIRSLAVIGAELASGTPSAAAGGTASLTGTVRVQGTQALTLGDFWVVLPAGWTVRNRGGAATPDITVGTTVFECSALCTTNTPRFNGVNRSIAQGTSQALAFEVNVPAGTAAGNYSVGLQLWTSQSGYGQDQETFLRDLVNVSVGRVRSVPPALDCPILTSWTTIPGGTTEADGTVIRVFFNGIERGTGTSAANRFAVGGWHGAAGTFGSLYGGLEVRATAQAPGENESVLSSACFVTQVSACQDGIDNDGDGLIDFPEDPGCSSPADGSEVDPECSDGIDNDLDGDVDWPADLECTGPDDDSEGGPPACGDGQDNDGDGLIDFPADPGCTSLMDRSELQNRRCSNGLDDDGDGLVDFPADPGCHSANDDDEGDFAYVPSDVRARMLVVFDTSGSMNWHSCADDFTGGDGSLSCPGNDVSCASCGSSSCSNGTPDDSRLFQARSGLRNAIAGYGEVEYGLMRFHQRPRTFSCPTSNASVGSGGWQGAGASPCSGFNGGDLLVGFSPENEYDMLEWMDGSTNYPGTPPPGLDYELRGTGTTPIAGSLDDARAYMESVRTGDLASSCRPYRVILITDGLETCGGNPVTAAGALSTAGFPTYVIGFATDDPATRDNLHAIAAAGGTTNAIFAGDSTTLSAAISDIVNDAILIETCNGFDDDCDGLIDEGFTLYCNVPGGVFSPTLCGDPGETVCNGVDDNCDGRVDEGLLNACGTCGTPPVEVCNGIDDDCDGPIDEGGVCDVCVVEPETCDGADNDCDGLVDEDLVRPCGNDTGECSSGTETCAAGVFGACTGTGPTAEVCDNLDNDCDGTIDGLTRPCGSAIGACRPGTETCTAGSFSGVCVGAVGPSAEICDNIDNNCNGSVDELNPGGGATCGSAIGACRMGTIQCTGGSLVCVGATGPVAETCNGADDDCDGATDEEIPTGAACGACGDGVLTCVGGTFVCRGDRTPGAEICNGVDDNCNGEIDEGNPGGGSACGTDTGECARGTTRCTGGTIVCEGAIGPGTETCNALDDDCDGLIDEGNPEGGATCGSSDVGECELGREACMGGTLVCVGETGPSPERCDGLDNDCNGEIDEGNPGSGAVCGISTGECEQGVVSCVGGTLVCVGAVDPTEEVCNDLDDDCDGVIDDGLDVGAPCGTSTGECVPGRLSCVGGDIICVCPSGFVDMTRTVGGVLEELCVPDPPGSLTETCNALDDDCDGLVDEDLPLGGVCGDAAGACVPGREQCIGGRVVCVGEIPARPEACDCEDNDCDGAVDEEPDTGSLCPSGSLCIDCTCARPCADSEFGRCPTGTVPVEGPEGCYCIPPRCNPTACAADTVMVGGVAACAPGDPVLPACECRGNECTFPCSGVVCGEPTVCHPRTGACVEDNCRGLGCPSGEICDVTVPECIPDPCETVECASDQACRRGTCEASCATVACDAGEVCRSGACVEDRCAGVSCPSGEVCDPADGGCVPNMCPRVCFDGSSCNPVDGGCELDPCTFLRCPDDQLCAGGECRLRVVPGPDAGMPPDAGPPRDAGGFDAGPVRDPEDRVLAAGGCLCGAAGASSGPPLGLGLLMGVGLAVLVWRRRRRAN